MIARRTTAPLETPARPALPLARVSEGSEVVLVRVDCGRAGRHRLAEMGLMPGAKMKVLSRGSPGPAIVLVKGTRLMIGRGTVPKVFVRPV